MMLLGRNGNAAVRQETTTFFLTSTLNIHRMKQQTNHPKKNFAHRRSLPKSQNRLFRGQNGLWPLYRVTTVVSLVRGENGMELGELVSMFAMLRSTAMQLTQWG